MSPAQPAIVIPVFNALAAVRSCLDSVRRTAPDARVVVIDDASTDPGVQALLQTWCAGSPRCSLIRHSDNAGFVRSVNEGIRMTDGDVVLLNSDTIVTPGWLDALARCLASDPAIASATPWSNNGEIVSFPEFCVANPVPAEPERLARAAAASKFRDYPDLPTAVGFCMGISRRAIEQVGAFDADAFGLGYGEENDFSLRAAAAGLRNVLCDDAYVAHLGGQSFGPLGLQPDQHSMQRLLARHPGYLELVQGFIEADPLAPRRAAMARALASAARRVG